MVPASRAARNHVQSADAAPRSGRNVISSSRKVEAMSTSLLPTNASLAVPFDRPTPRPAQSAGLLALEPRAQHEESRNGRTGLDPASRRRDTPRVVHPAVDISPSHL